eukprot:9664617-Heterocapsa_arctica.AAC.1
MVCFKSSLSPSLLTVVFPAQMQSTAVGVAELMDEASLAKLCPQGKQLGHCGIPATQDCEHGGRIPVTKHQSLPLEQSNN